MKKVLLSSILTTFVLSSCGQATFPPHPTLTPNNGVVSNHVNSMSSRYKPVPVERTNRFSVDFFITTNTANSIKVIGAPCNKFIKQAQLKEDGDIEKYSFETFNGGKVVRLTFIGVQNPKQLKQEIFQNLVQFVFNDLKKTMPFTGYIELSSVRLVDTSDSQPSLIEEIDF